MAPFTPVTNASNCDALCLAAATQLPGCARPGGVILAGGAHCPVSPNPGDVCRAIFADYEKVKLVCILLRGRDARAWRCEAHGCYRSRSGSPAATANDPCHVDPAIVANDEYIELVRTLLRGSNRCARRSEVRLC